MPSPIVLLLVLGLTTHLARADGPPIPAIEVIDLTDLDWASNRDAIKELDSLLVSTENSDDAQANLAALTQAYSTFMNEGLNPQDVLMKLIKSFAAMRIMFTPDKCSKMSYEILKQNQHSLQRRIDLPSRRLLNILTELMAIHARDCKDVHLNAFRQKFAGLNRSKMNQLEYLFNVENFVSSPQLAASELTYAVMVDSENLSNFMLSPLTLYNKLKFSARNDPKRRYLSKKESGGWIVEAELKSLWEKYILEPCRYLRIELGDVYGPVGFVYKKETFSQSAEPEFYYNWARYYLCNKLEEKNELRIPKFDLVVYVAKQN